MSEVVIGADLVGASTTQDVFNTVATTIHAFGAATTLNLGAVTGTTTINNNLIVAGDLTINGTTTTVNSTVTTLDDPIITLGGDTAPTSDDSKDRGVEFRWHDGSSAKVGFFGFDDSTGKFTFLPDATNTSEIFAGTKGTIDAYFSGSDISSGLVSATYGGTGVDNSGKTITLGGNLTTSGAFATTLTVTAATNVTLPTTGTLATTAALASYLPLAGGTLTGDLILKSLAIKTQNSAGSYRWSIDGSGDFYLSTLADGGGGVASPLYINRSTLLTTLGGDLTISKPAVTSIINSTSGMALLSIQGVAGQWRELAFKTGATYRWSFDVDTAAESGSNAGSNFALYRFNDAGGVGGTPISINRATGLTTLESLSVTGATTLTGATALNGAVTFSASQHLIKNGTPTTLNFAKGSSFGYSSGYRVVVLGDTATTPNNVTVSIGYDPVGNTSGSFSGDGREVLFRNAVEFTTPNSANTGWLKPLKFDASGNSTVLALTGTDTTDASSSITGAFKTAGGLGVAKSLYVGTDAIISGYVSLGAVTGDRLMVYGAKDGATAYGFGIESGTMYYRANATHRWYVGHVADAGVSEKMRLDANGFYPNYLNLGNTADTATAATHYFVETATDGFVRPKTLANVQSEIVTTTAVNTAAATTLGTLTTDLSISKAAATATISASSGNSSLSLNVVSGSAGAIRFRTGTSQRWVIQKNGLSETGSNAGSNLEVIALDDSGNTLSTPLAITRSTGTATFSGIVQAGTSLGITSGPTWINDAGKWMTSAGLRVDGAIYAISTLRFGGMADVILQRDNTLSLSSNSDITISKASAQLYLNATSGTGLLLLGGAAASAKRVYCLTAGNNRWAFGSDTTAESGSNAGSDFGLLSYTDAGALLRTDLTVNRATGKTTLGSVGATAGLELGSSGPRVMSGTGSPESVVTAPVGSTWTDTAATNGAIQWIKATGTGNTGWVVQYGDTGARNVTSLKNVIGTLTLTTLQVRRIGPLVSMAIDFADSQTNPSSVALFTLPSGFKPTGGPLYFDSPYNSSNTTAVRRMRISASTGIVYYGGATDASGYAVNMSWMTADAWPTSLPGSAA